MPVKITTPHILKLFALIFWYLSFVFLATILTLQNHSSLFQTTVRGGEYRWDFEAMFTAIYFVWGIYCWKASKVPEKHILFIDFTIWANILHAIVMTLVGAFRPGEFYHLLTDSLVIFIPALVLLYTKSRLPKETL